VSRLKRGIKGVYQHCSEKHLHRYLAEFDFRYSHCIALGVDDFQRAEIAVKGISGKRLTFEGPVSKQRRRLIKWQAKRFLAWRKRKKNLDFGK
jgi:ISXO2-like transposase domain